MHSSPGHNSDILFTALALINHRIRIRRRLELETPKLLAILRIECAESIVIDGADEHESTRGRSRTRERIHRPAGVLLRFG